MSTWDEKAEAMLRWPGSGFPDVDDAHQQARAGFMQGARWMRVALQSDEAVLRALNAADPARATDRLEDWSDETIARMRASLIAAIGEGA